MILWILIIYCSIMIKWDIYIYFIISLCEILYLVFLWLLLTIDDDDMFENPVKIPGPDSTGWRPDAQLDWGFTRWQTETDLQTYHAWALTVRRSYYHQVKRLIIVHVPTTKNLTTHTVQIPDTVLDFATANLCVSCSSRPTQYSQKRVQQLKKNVKSHVFWIL